MAFIVPFKEAALLERCLGSSRISLLELGVVLKILVSLRFRG